MILPEDHMTGACTNCSKLTSGWHQASWQQQEMSKHSGMPTLNQPSWTGSPLTSSCPTTLEGLHPVLKETINATNALIKMVLLKQKLLKWQSSAV